MNNGAQPKVTVTAAGFLFGLAVFTSAASSQVQKPPDEEAVQNQATIQPTWRQSVADGANAVGRTLSRTANSARLVEDYINELSGGGEPGVRLRDASPLAPSNWLEDLADRSERVDDFWEDLERRATAPQHVEKLPEVQEEAGEDASRPACVARHNLWAVADRSPSTSGLCRHHLIWYELDLTNLERNRNLSATNEQWIPFYERSIADVAEREADILRECRMRVCE